MVTMILQCNSLSSQAENSMTGRAHMEEALFG